MDAQSTGQPAMILTRPQMGENIGGAARAMLNFGLERMRIIAPRDGWPNGRAVAMASGAGRLLDQAGLYPDLPAAIADCHFVFATTARPRDLTKPVFTPEAAMREARVRLGRGEQVGFLFGPERAGLENADIARASAIVSVPVNAGFASLNLAQAVLLLSYEWQRAQDGDFVPPDMKSGAASAIEVQKLGDHYEEQLNAASFFFPPTKAAGMKLVLRNLWSRLPLTHADVQMLHGILRQMVRWKDHADRGPD